MKIGRIAVASGKQEPEHDVAEQEPGAEEAEVGEGEGGHRGDDERQQTVRAAIKSELPSTCQ